MLYKLSLLIALTAATFPLFSQITIRGHVMQNPTTPIEFCNVLVLNPVDSTLIQGELVENSSFELTVNTTEFLLKIDAVGYEDWYQIVNQTTDFGAIYLTAYALDVVEITAKKLPFDMQNGNTKINVDHGIFRSTSSAQEILSKSPGVVVANGTVSVIGSGEALIYLEGKAITWAALQSIPVSQIESIEIVKNPDASYDAEGKAIILVVLKELGLEGIQGTFTMHYTRGFYHLGYGDLNLQFKKGKWTLNGATNRNFGATGTKRIDSYRVNEGTTPYTADGIYREKVYLPNVTNYLAGVRYQISPNQVFSAQFNSNYSLYDLEVENRINQTIENTLFEIHTLDTAVSIYKTNALSANYSLKLDSLGSQLFAGFTYSGFVVSYEDSIQEIERSAIQTRVLNSNSAGTSKNGIGTGQLDYVKNFKGGSILKIGTKMSKIVSNSSVYLNTLESDSVVNYRNDQFEYREQILAGYTNWNRNWLKGDFQIGLRAEQTQSKALKIGDSEAYLDTTYLSLFPNAGINTKFKNWSMSDQFTSKISRPRFSEITPYIYYLNAFTSVYGNPNVKPSFNYNFEHKFRYKTMSLSLGYNYTNQPRTFVTLQDNLTESTNVMQTVNVDRLDEFYIAFRKSTEIGAWYNFILVNLSYSTYTSSVYDFGGLKTTPKLYAYTYNQINVRKWFDFEVIGEFNSAYEDGRRKVNATGELDLGISKTFANGSCFAQITVNDIFQTAKPNGVNFINGNEYGSITTQDTRFMRVLFTYTFGKLKEPNYDHLQLNESESERAQ